MRRPLSAALIVGLLATGGCGSRPMGNEPGQHVKDPTTTATGASTSDSTDASGSKSPSPKTDPIHNIRALYNQQQVAWVLVDDDNRVLLFHYGSEASSRVVAGDLNTKQLIQLFSTPDVDEVVLLGSSQGYRTSPPAYYGAVRRDTFRSWLQRGELSFPTADWSRRMDVYAERTVPAAQITPRLFDEEKFKTELRSWLEERLGGRLLRVDFQRPARKSWMSEDPRPDLTVVVKQGALSEQQRVEEAAGILGLITLAQNVGRKIVEYEGVGRVQRIEALDLWKWARDSGDREKLANWLIIDGSKGRGSPDVDEPAGKPDDLVTLLRKREHIKGLLPHGNRLLVGLHGKSQYGNGALAVEAEVPTSQTWEQTWTTYQHLVDTLYSEEPEVLNILLLLHRGQELEVFTTSRYRWGPQSRLAQLVGEPLDPGLFPLRSNTYDRYTVVPR